MEKLIHLLIPRQSNNHKAKILHSDSLIVVACLFLIFQGIINFFPNLKPHILGFSAQISPDEVIRLTNQKRAEAGLPPLTYNQTLSSAAYTKGRDMIDRDYWAHVAPDGTAPWKFFTQFGYRYRYAGENLARDFSSAGAAVEAWMNSPSHRDNILNPKYKEIGVGVTEGDLAGVDTTIIVQFFGATYADQTPQKVAEAQKMPERRDTQNIAKKANAQEAKQTSNPVNTPIAVQTITPQVQAQIVTPQPNQRVLISPFTTTKNISLIVVALLLLVFIVDALLVSRRRIVRIAGRSFAHVIFLGIVLVIVLILESGRIL